MTGGHKKFFWNKLFQISELERDKVFMHFERIGFKDKLSWRGNADS
jgi:hypothetical protein